MPYIIDANNLAGKLKMLGDKNFDKKLIDMIKQRNKDTLGSAGQAQYI